MGAASMPAATGQEPLEAGSSGGAQLHTTG